MTIRVDHSSACRRGSAVAWVLLGVWCIVAHTAARVTPGQFLDATGAAPERLSSEPPAYNLLRYEEDYSYLRNSGKRTDWLDPLKFIPLDADGRIYLTLGGEMRQRFEHYSGSGVSNGSVDGRADSYYLARYLLHADLHLGEDLRVFFQLKGNTEEGRRGGPRPSIDRDDFDVHQAFFDWRLPVRGDTTLLVRLGRQELAYGDDRLIDVREGPNVRQSFDAARLSLQDPGYKVDALFARAVATNKGVFDDGYDLQQAEVWGLYATISLPFLRRLHSADAPAIDLYYLGYDRQNGPFDQTARRGSPPATGHETRHSLGGRLHGTVFPLGGGPLTGEFHYDVEGLYQFGRFGDAGISAYEASFDLGYYFQRLPFGPNLSLRLDVASGDADARDRRLQTFNPLFPKGIYFSEPSFLGPSNLIALHPVVDWHPRKNLGLMTTVIAYWRQDTGDVIYNFNGTPALPGSPVATRPMRGNVPGGSRYVGAEADAWLEWGINRHLTFDLSYSHFFAGTYARDSAALNNTPGGRNHQSFDYVAAWLTFTF